jgi:hypothetical protein
MSHTVNPLCTQAKRQKGIEQEQKETKISIEFYCVLNLIFLVKSFADIRGLIYNIIFLNHIWSRKMREG